MSVKRLDLVNNFTCGKCLKGFDTMGLLVNHSKECPGKDERGHIVDCPKCHTLFDVSEVVMFEFERILNKLKKEAYNG